MRYRSSGGGFGGADGSAVELQGKITRIFYGSESFTTGELRDSESGRFVKFAGPCRVQVDDRVILKGVWTTHEKFGKQVRVDAVELDMNLDSDGLIAWLAGSAVAKGIGPARARAIVAAAGGADGFEAALSEPEKLADAAGVPVNVVVDLRSEWETRRAVNLASVALSRWGISPGRIAKLIGWYGPTVVSIVEKNPYWLIGKVPRFGFGTVDDIAMQTGIRRDHPDRIRACVFSILENESMSEGCTWIGFDDLVLDASKKLRIDSEDGGFEAISSIIEEMQADVVEVVVDRTTDRKIVFLKNLIAAEQFVADKLAAAGDLEWLKVTPTEILEVAPDITDEQAEAVSNAFSRRGSVISGGAGVGKTYTVAAIVTLAESRGATVALCAPTGKAAQRLGELVGKSASTIHRLLSPIMVKKDRRNDREGEQTDDDLENDDASDSELHFTFEHNESNPIDAGLVVVDEVSMVDVRLARHLLRAIDFSKTSLVMVGDHNQLPPVGPGAVLRDALARAVCPVTVLSKVIRQAGELKRNTSAVLDGRVASTSVSAKDAFAKMEAGEPAKVAPWYVFRSETTDAALTAIRSLFSEKLERYSIERNGQLERIDAAWDVQLLTPMHKGPLGTVALNAMLQRIFQRREGVDVAPWDGKSIPKPMVGDKVIFTKNDVKLGVMNGNTGRVLQIDKDGAVILFDGFEEPTAVPSEKFRDQVRLAYALSVHKSQGSEYPIAVFVCAKPHTIMHHRGLFYTAVSRARQSAFVVGDQRSINRCAWLVKSDRRRTLANLGAIVPVGSVAVS